MAEDKDEIRRLKALVVMYQDGLELDRNDLVSRVVELRAENADLRREVERLNRLNEDKFEHIEAYCKAASEDKAEIERLKAELADAEKRGMERAIERFAKIRCNLTGCETNGTRHNNEDCPVGVIEAISAELERKP